MPSLSVTVSVTLAGFATPLPPAAVAETVTCLLAVRISLLTAVMVTVPVLVVALAAMVSVRARDSVKSRAVAPVPGAACTVTVTGALEAPDRVAVTVATPPVSEIDEGDSARASIGVPSSSISVRVVGSGGRMSPATLPEIVTCALGASALSSVAVMVTVPVLAVAPSAKANAVVPESVKSVPAPGLAATVTVAAPEAGLSSVAVTVATPPFSGIDEDDRVSVAFGSATMGTHSA